MEEDTKKKVRKLVKENLRWIILMVSTILFLKIIKNVLEEEIELFDTRMYQIIAGLISPTMTQVVKIITMMGSGYVILSVCLLSVFFFRKKKESFYILLNLSIIFLLNQGLKFIIARPRPEGFRIIEENGYSFPSGHSMVSMAFYGLFIYFIYKKDQKNYRKWMIIGFLTLLILLIGISRIYLGVHYTSDVIAGFLLSISYLAIFTKIIGKKLN